MRIWASFTGCPSGPFTTPSMATNWAHAAQLSSKKQATNRTYPRYLASMMVPSRGVDFIKPQDTTTPRGLALHLAMKKQSAWRLLILDQDGVSLSIGEKAAIELGAVGE